MKDKKKIFELIFVPCPTTGHVISTIEFATRLVSHHPQFHATILLTQPPPNAPTTPPPPSDNLRHITLPPVTPPPTHLFHECPESYVSTYIASHKPHVADAIANSVNPSHQLAGIVVDMFSVSMIDLAHELNLPSYVFYTSSTASLGLFLHLPSHRTRTSYLTVSDPDLTVSSYANPLPARVMPVPLLSKIGYELFFDNAGRFNETAGIIVNSFAELEPFATDSFINWKPKLYTVGPVLALEAGAHGRVETGRDRDRIVKWLDAQPDSSVVFLCFGSVGAFGAAQVLEIAKGLEASGVRFLWALRKPPGKDGKVRGPEEYSEEELNEVLPQSFLTLLDSEGGNGRGLVCGWVPQVEVLAHKAIGGFVSHCGWNSILESLWHGVPTVTWPMYAEQHINAFQLVKELGLGVELRLDYRMGEGEEVVEGEEIERAIRCVMKNDNSVRQRVKEIGEISKRVLKEGGSSFEAMECLVRDMLENLNV